MYWAVIHSLVLFGLALRSSVEDLPPVLTGEALMKCVRKLISEEAYTHAERDMWESAPLEVQGFQGKPGPGKLTASLES